MEDYNYVHNPDEMNIDHSGSELVTCPYCGKELGYDISIEVTMRISNAHSLNDICKKCNNLYSITWEQDYDEEDQLHQTPRFWTDHEEQNDKNEKYKHWY